MAQLAVECLENPAARNRTLELGGPENLSPLQVIKIFEQATGKTFEVAHIPPEALQGQYADAVDPMQKSFIGLMMCYADGDPIDMGPIQKTFATRLTPVKEYVTGMG